MQFRRKAKRIPSGPIWVVFANTESGFGDALVPWWTASEIPHLPAMALHLHLEVIITV
jgi:hypothetical protein